MKQLILATMGELALKGMNRHVFEKILLKALRTRLSGLGEWQVRSAQSTIYIEPKDEKALANADVAFDRCSKTFGIAGITRAAICEKNYDSIAQTAVEYLDSQLRQAKTFKVASKRADKSFPLNSMELSQELGGYILERYPHLTVDVHHPELMVTAEVRDFAAYVHGGKERGAGGLPVPVSGRATVLLSGGIDSPVAAWQMAKRGLGLVAVHFASPPYTSSRASAKVEALADLLTAYTGPLPYYEVPYTKAQEYMRDALPEQEYFTVMMRRSMMRIANIISQKEGCEALITGESLAQVASQTMQALACTDAAQELPVLRPCIGMDKVEIMEISRKIGTYETSIQPYEDCCTIFTPAHPKTKPRLVDILRNEQAMPLLPQLEEEAAAQAIFSLRRLY